MHNCSDRVTERRDAIKNAKDAKSAKDAKGANPWKLALLALLGRAGDLIGAETGGNGDGAAEGIAAEAKTPQTSPRRTPGTLRVTWGKTKGNGPDAEKAEDAEATAYIHRLHRCTQMSTKDNGAVQPYEALKGQNVTARGQRPG